MIEQRASRGEQLGLEVVEGLVTPFVELSWIALTLGEFAAKRLELATQLGLFNFARLMQLSSRLRDRVLIAGAAVDVTRSGLVKLAPKLGDLGVALSRLMTSSIRLGIAFAEPICLLVAFEASSRTGLVGSLALPVCGRSGGLVLLGDDALGVTLLIRSM